MEWQCAAYSRLLLHRHQGSEEILLFDSGSGNTHVIDPVAAEVLQTLQKGPADVDTLVLGVAAALKLPPDRPLESYIDTLLHTLHRQHLIQPAIE